MFLKEAYPQVEREKRDCLQAILYVLAQKFLNENDLKMVKEEFGMSYLGQLIYDDGFEAGKEKCIITLIQADMQDGVTKDSVFEKLRKVFHLEDEKLENYWQKSQA